ncbi:MAG: SDR family oxidoreductase [Ginsengibacter sp.]
MSKILITGATGHLGTAVINQLLKNTSADNIVALARDENKVNSLKEKGVEIRLGNFDDTASLSKALQEIEKVLLISTADTNRFQQHKNVVDAAKKAGVKFIAYTSVPVKDLNSTVAKPLLESHFQTEDYIKASGMTYAFLRNNIYADMVPIYVGEKVFETGIYLPAGSGKVPFALRREMGEGTANLLLQSDRHQSKTYDITNTELYSFEDVASVFSELSGKIITYTDADIDEFTKTLKEGNIPEQFIFIVTAFITDFKNHQYEKTTNDLEKLLGRKPATLKEALKELYKL